MISHCFRRYKLWRIRRLIKKYSCIAQLCRERNQHLLKHKLSYITDPDWQFLHSEEICLALKLDDLVGIGEWSSPPIL